MFGEDVDKTLVARFYGSSYSAICCVVNEMIMAETRLSVHVYYRHYQTVHRLTRYRL